MTILRSLYTAALAAILFATCTDPPKTDSDKPANGNWLLTFVVGEVKIPIQVGVEDSVWHIHNADETILIDSLVWNKKSFRVKMPLFNTSLSGELINENEIRGIWTDHSRDSVYTIPFVMTHAGGTKSTDATTRLSERTFECTFSPGLPDDMYKAVGIIREHEGGKLNGTFLTEAGDYRYLSGNTTGRSMQLSCFDGTHLFHFCANVQGDSLTDGMFYSGKHWSEPWEAVANPDAALRNPDSLTFVTNAAGKFQFKARNEVGDSVLFNEQLFAGKVSVVQIYGSWCPNCTDESIFLKGLYEKYHAQGLQVIPVAFERSEDFSIARTAIRDQFGQLKIPYPSYFGGRKSTASAVFSDLSKILSYPTAIFIDKQGKVRKIHTGFYGPGTGDYYTRNTEILDMFVRQLLAEK
ncbi:MAG: TlpA family protein disulfide reductase [Flavobacteriales bacterium]